MFCFLCGLLSHSDQFCDQRFGGVEDSGERQWGNFLKVEQRRPGGGAANRWLREEKDGRKSSETHAADILCENHGPSDNADRHNIFELKNSTNVVGGSSAITINTNNGPGKEACAESLSNAIIQGSASLALNLNPNHAVMGQPVMEVSIGSNNDVQVEKKRRHFEANIHMQNNELATVTSKVADHDVNMIIMHSNLAF